MPLQDPAAPIKALSADMQKIHFKTQVIRFIRLYVSNFLGMVIFLSGPAITWKALAALVLPSVEITVREIWPALPIDKLFAVFDRHTKASTPVPASLRAGAVAASRWATVQKTMADPADAPAPAELLEAFQEVADHLDPTGIPATPKPDIVIAPPISTNGIVSTDIRSGTLAPETPVTDVPLPAVDDSPAAMPESTGTPAQ